MANIYIDPNAMQPQVVNTDGYTGVVPPSITPQDVLKHEVDMAKIEQAKAKADGALAKAKPQKEESVLGKNIDFSVSINPLDAVLRALPGGAVASNLVKAAKASNSEPSTDGYSINANGEVVNSHGVILPRNTPRTERIKQALLGANNSEEQTQPQGDGYFSNTNTNDLMPHFGDANAKFGVNEGMGALAQAKPQVTSTKQSPKTTEFQNAGETNLDRIVKSLDPQGNGSGTIRTEDIDAIYNEAQASLLDKQEKLGKQFNDLGGTAGLSRMADDILQNKSVEQIVKDRLDAMGKLSGAEQSEDNVMASISHLIYKTAQDNNLHPAMAAELVFQSLDGENGWKHWFDANTDVTSNTTLLDDSLKAKIKAVSGRKQPLDSAFRQMLKLRQLQNNVDNYKKQIDGSTTNLLGAESFLANRPSDSAGYERFMDKYANMLNQHRNLAYQYASVAKALRDYKVE